MSTEAAGGGTQSGSAEALEREIERTRHELGETVEALVAKTDVKARARQRATQLTANLRRTARGLMGKARGRAVEGAQSARKQVTERGPAIARDNRARGGIAAAILGAFTLAWLAGRRRRRR